jgi:orotidine-5'-phosphate decarboxylase
MNAHERIFVAVDTPDAARAKALALALHGRVGGFKVGLEAFVANGPALVEEIRAIGLPVFLDLKLHDIPNTVAGAAAAAGRLGVAFLTVHALGAASMIRRAVEASAEGAAASGHPAPCVLAVTVLTSHDDLSLASVGVTGPCLPAVERLAAVAREARAGGLVCSPLEIVRARAIFPAATLVVPGIRPATPGPRPVDDQSRVATPGEAVAWGADRIVVGRPITGAADPAAAAEAIAADIEATSPA